MKKRLFFLLLIVLTFTLGFFISKNNNDVNAEEQSVYEVLNEYYNEGTYEKHTIIYLSDDGVDDLAQHFHVENYLERKTYYTPDSLWMSQGVEEDGVKYSYYGTSYSNGKANGVTYAVIEEPLLEPESSKVVLSGEGKNSMEEYYTTLLDLIEYKTEWTYKNGVYTVTDETVLDYFLDFTAPCLYGSVLESNVFSYLKATVEVNQNGDLELKLWVSALDYGFIVGGEESVIDDGVILSSATISHNHSHGDVYSYDSENHWYECSCGNKKDVGEHTFDNGKVYNDITMEYTCKVCGYVKYDVTEDDLTAGIDNSKYGLAIRVPEDRDIKILQLADVHFGYDTRNWHNNKIERTKEYITTMISEQQPDLIVCSGDNIIGTGIVNDDNSAHDLTEFCTFIDSFGIPWTFMYGNHDAETKVKSEYSEQLLAWIADGTLKHLLYEEEYVEEADLTFSTSDEGRYGNFSIQILNPMGDKLLGSIILFDAGTYLYDLGYYQAHTTGQVAWYEQKIASLQAMYSAQEGNLHTIIPTIVFTHIQLPEHDIAYNQAYYHPENTDYEFVIRQDSLANSFTDTAIEGLDPNTDNGLFDKMVELGSTKAVFVGHAHTHDFQVKSNGIVLGYGPQTGFSKVFDNNENPRHTYMYNVANDFSFTTTSIYEEYEEPSGFNYTYASVNDNTELDRYAFNYDEEKDVYYGIVYMAAWSKIKLRYNGTVLTPENTNIVGDYNPSSTSYKLYTPASREYYMSNANCNYAFIYEPSTNTLTIHDVRGLTYSGTYNGEAEYDIFTDTYTINNTYSLWGNITFTYGGVALNPDNTTFSGYFHNGDNTATVRLYPSDSIDNNYVNGHTTPVTYNITLNATTNVLNIDVTNVNGIDLDADSGLVYTGYRVGSARYDEGSGTYRFAASYKIWGCIEIFYNGELINPFDSETVELVNNTGLYSGNPQSRIINAVSGAAYQFIFTPATETDKAKLVIDYAGVTVDTNNSDGGADKLSVWTTAGTELKSVTDESTGASSWIGNGWRLYIVCDSEGKIAYMVQNPPNGFGGPNGYSYYCHSSYSSSYTTNPAFNILDGYGPWVSGGYVHNLYEVKIPEGGFAITAHGEGITRLYEMLGITSSADGDVNKRELLSDDLRLSYDANYNIVIVSK